MESAGKARISWEKLRRVEKRGGNSTHSASFWRINATNFSQGRIISSRKLAAALWELHPYKLPLDNTRRRRADEDVGGSESLLHHRFHLHEQLVCNGRYFRCGRPRFNANIFRSSSQKVRRNGGGVYLLMNHRSIEKSNRATQSVSTSSCSSSMEIAPCNPITASTSSEPEPKNGKSAYSLKTSTQLLKVLNRVRSLEEQQVSSISLIRGLKKELDRARFHAQESSGGELLRKNKEQDVINARFQSIRDELQNERKSKKNSKSLQRKLAQELCEVKSSLLSISKELEGERMSLVVLEELCDELAWGLRDFEKEMHDLKQKSDKDLDGRDDHDQLILRIAQAWLDERRDVVENNPTIRNPSSRIEGSLQNERTSEEKTNGNLMLGGPLFRKGSLKSISLNYGATTRRERDDDNDNGSSSSHSNCFEAEETNESSLNLHRHEIQESHFEEMMKQAKSKEHMARAIFEADKDEVSEDTQESAVENIIRYGCSFSENGRQCNKDHLVASSLGRSFHSPVREWTAKLPAQNLETSEIPLTFLCGLKGSTLKAKLSETRSGGQKSRSRQKASIYPSRE